MDTIFVPWVLTTALRCMRNWFETSCTFMIANTFRQHQRPSVSGFVWTKTRKERYIQYAVFRSSYSQLLTSNMVSVAGEARRPCGGLPFTFSKLQRWHYVAGQLHVWQDYSHGAGIFIIGQTTEARAMREELAVESADGHRPWLLSECEMPKPDCSAEPGGQRRSRLLSPTHRASKTIWHEDFIPT